jgi:uncharacterized protein
MSQSSHGPRTSDTEATTTPDAAIVAATQRWIERAVIGLNLCPFARAPFVQQRIAFRVSHARDAEALTSDLRDELQLLHSTDAQVCETTLLIHPFVLADFADYNDFLGVADRTLRSLGMQGEIQIASFHPHYRFADTAADAIENYSNRSPYPILHLLREASIARASVSMADTDNIYRHNMETLRVLGADGWRALWRDDDSDEKP